MIKKISKIFFVMTAIFAGDIVFATQALAAGAFAANLPQCTANTAKQRGGANCLKEMNANSCINTTPFSPVGGVSSEMCIRGQDWCDRNKRQWGGSRCDSNGKVKSSPGKPHQGYDYSAPCGTKIYAPCDGKVTRGKPNGLQFTCEICGKTYEYTFYHNQSSVSPGFYRKNELIGYSGDLNNYPCHMHIEIRQGVGGTMMDPMSPEFDSVVCSCYGGEHQVDRSKCFSGYNPSNTLPDVEPTCDGGECADDPNSFSTHTHNSNPGNSSFDDPDCIYDNVILKYSSWSCLFCKPFKIIFNTMSTMAQRSYDAFAKYVVLVVSVGFAIWLGIVILKTVSTFNKAEPRILIKTILEQTFRFLVVIFLLLGPLKQILDFSINPVFETGLRVAQLASGYVGVDGAASCNLGDDAVVEEGAVSASFGNGVLCIVKVVQTKIMNIVALGRVSHCMAWENTTWKIIPNFAYLLSALIFMIAGYLLIIIYPFLLIDSLLKLTVVIALLPLALGAFVFRMNYLKKIWETFLNAVFTFIFLSMVISIIAQIATRYAEEILNSEVLSYRIASVLWFTSGGIKLAFVCFLGWALLNEIKPFASKFGGGIKLDVGAKVGGTIAAVAQRTVGKPLKKAAINTTSKIANVAYKNASHLKRHVNAIRFEALGEEARDDSGNLMLDDQGNQMYVDKSITPGNLYRRLRGKQTYRSYNVDENGNVMETKTTTTKASKDVVQRNVSKEKEGKVALDENGNKMLDDQGNQMYVDRSLTPKNLWNRFRGKKTYRSYSKDQDGNIIENKTTLTTDSKTVRKKDAFGKVKEKDGVVVKTDINNHKLLLRGGRLDRQEMNNFMQNSLLSDEEKKVALVKQLVDERMGNYTGGRLDGSYKKRNVSSQKDENGNDVIRIQQINNDGTLSTFEARFNDNDRVMTSVKTQDAKGNAIEYATDGIIQRKSVTENGSTLHKYAVSSYYDSTERPVYIDGSVASTIDPENIMFSKDDMQRFGEQVHIAGNRRYTFGEFKSTKNDRIF